MLVRGRAGVQREHEPVRQFLLQRGSAAQQGQQNSRVLPGHPEDAAADESLPFESAGAAAPLDAGPARALQPAHGKHCLCAAGGEAEADPERASGGAAVPADAEHYEVRRVVMAHVNACLLATRGRDG